MKEEIRKHLESQNTVLAVGAERTRVFSDYQGALDKNANNAVGVIRQKYDDFQNLNDQSVAALYQLITDIRDDLADLDKEKEWLSSLVNKQIDDIFISDLKYAYVFKVQSLLSRNLTLMNASPQEVQKFSLFIQNFAKINDFIRKGSCVEEVQQIFQDRLRKKYTTPIPTRAEVQAGGKSETILGTIFNIFQTQNTEVSPPEIFRHTGIGNATMQSKIVAFEALFDKQIEFIQQQGAVIKTGDLLYAIEIGLDLTRKLIALDPSNEKKYFDVMYATLSASQKFTENVQVLTVINDHLRIMDLEKSRSDSIQP